MKPKFLVGVYWAPRSDTFDSTVEVLDRTLRRLGELGPVLGVWSFGRERVEGHVADRDDVAAVLRAGAMTDDFGKPWPELGASLSLVSSPDDANSASLEAAVMIQRLPNTNSVVVTPTYGARDEEAWRRWLRPMLSILVEEWRPDWAVAGTMQALRAQREVLESPGANLLTWVPSTEVPALPVARRSELAGGTLLELGGGSEGNGSDAAVVALARALGDAGLGPQFRATA